MKLKFGETPDTHRVYKNSVAMHGFVTCSVCESTADQYDSGYFFVEHYGVNREKIYMNIKYNQVFCGGCVETFDHTYETPLMAQYA